MIERYYISNDGITPAEEAGNWIRVSSPNNTEIEQLSNETGIDAHDLRRSMKRDKGAAFSIEKGYTMILLDAPYENKGGNSLYNTSSVSIYCTGDRIITVSQKKTDIFTKFIEKPPKNLDMKKKDDVQMRMIIAIMDQYNTFINHINQMRKDIEKRISKKVKDDDIYTLHQMGSSLIYFITSLKSFQPVIDKIGKNLDGKMDQTTDDLLDDLKIMVSQNSERATIYKEVVDNAGELCNTMVSNDLNDVMKLLTVITLVLSIPVLIAGIYGMNVVLPMSDYEYGFELVCVIMVVLTAMVLFFLKWKKIL